MKSTYIVPLSILLGAILEFAALFIGVAFTGVKDFGPHWGLAAISLLGLWPDALLQLLLPSLPERWSNLALIAPIMGWAFVGTIVALWLERREQPDRGN